MNALENVDIRRFISMFYQKKRVINVTFRYSADKLESGKNHEKRNGNNDQCLHWNFTPAEIDLIITLKTYRISDFD